MRILFTGSGGRLGRLLFAARDVMGDTGYELVFQSRGTGRDLRWQPGEPMSRLPACDILVALWGATSGTADALAVNSTLVDLSREVARKCGATRIFHLSSAAVYGPGAGMSEDMPMRPKNAYGQAKADMETAVFSGSDGIAQTALRLANVVGADSLGAALCGDEPVHLDRFSDGRGPLRSYIGAMDLLRILCGLSRVEREVLPLVLNIAAPTPVAMEALARAAGKEVIWRPAPPEAVQEVSLDVGRMCALLPHVQPSAEAGTLISDLRRLEAVR